MKKIAVILIAVFCMNSIFAQNDSDYPDSFKELYSVIFDGDTFATIDVEPVSVIHYKFNDTREKFLYNRTKRRIEKIIPYYDIAIKVMEDLNTKEEEANKKAYKKYKRQTKKELVSKFEKELRDLSRSEGKILVKMINRNTGFSFNDLIKEYTNPLKVWGYNLVANHYGYDLKEEYDAKDPENKHIEMALKAMDY